MVIIMNYDLKANLTTILTFLLMPFLAGLGVDAYTGNAFISVIVLIIFYVLMYLNERYLSGIFTKKGYEVVNVDNQATCDCEKDALNQDYFVDDD